MVADPSARTAELYLRLLTAYAPRHSFLDIRYRARGGRFIQLFLAVDAPDMARTVVRIARRSDVYVGCAPRLCRRGRREDVAPTALLWADCDGPSAVAALASFRPAASMIVASGSGENTHAYWALTRTLPVQELEHANRRLAAALGADARCADAARILRPPGTRNFKHSPPRPVALLGYNLERYELAQILSALPSLQVHPVKDGTAPTLLQEHRVDRASDPLLLIDPPHYVTVLTGREPGRDSKILCPLHEERNPSFHVYPTPERGWTCFGCPTPDGRPLGGDIYKLASLLWDVPLRGRGFLVLRARLQADLGIIRSRRARIE